MKRRYLPTPIPTNKLTSMKLWADLWAAEPRQPGSEHSFAFARMGSTVPETFTCLPRPTERPVAIRSWTALSGTQHRYTLRGTKTMFVNETKYVFDFVLVSASMNSFPDEKDRSRPRLEKPALRSWTGLPDFWHHDLFSAVPYPTQIVRLLARLVDPRPGSRLPDPACGSASMLLHAAQVMQSKDSRDHTLFNQTVSGVPWSLTRADVFLHRRNGARFGWGGRLRDPKLISGRSLIFSDPPYGFGKQDAELVAYVRFGTKVPAPPSLLTETRAAVIPAGTDLFEPQYRPLPSDTTYAPDDVVAPLLKAPAFSPLLTETRADVIPAETELSDTRYRLLPSNTMHVPDDVFIWPPKASALSPFLTEARAAVTPAETDLFGTRHQPLPSGTTYVSDDEVASPLKAPASSPLLMEMPALIRSWTDLSNTRRRDLLSAVSSARRIDAIPGFRQALPAPLPLPATMSCSYLNTRLFRQAHAIYGIKSPERFANILSQLRFILRRLGGHEPPSANIRTLRAPWRRLHDALPTKHRQTALSGFMRFCSARSVAPPAVNTETLADFEAWLLERTLCRDAPVRARAVASNWTWAREHVPGWPDVPLKRPRMREQYVLPFEAYPPALRADAERYLARLAFADVGDIFPDDAAVRTGARAGRRTGLKPRTIDGRSFQLRQCLVALVKLGRNPATIMSLQELVDPPEQAYAIMKFYLDRAEGQRTSQTRAIGEVLRQLARFHCNLTSAAADRIAFWARNAAPEVEFCISPNNMQRVQALLQPHVTRALLRLPDVLMEEAAHPELRPHAAALLALYATALNILFAFPMRRSNLAGLRLDQHLQRSGRGGRLVNYILLQANETKGAKSMLWPLPERVATLLEVYLKRYRPLLTQHGNPYLFPQTGMAGRSAHDLAVGLTRLVESRIGCEFNMHLVRHFVVALHLRHNPGQYDVARQLLGHASTSYTIAVYAPFDVESAARSLDQTLTIERTAAAPTAPAPLRQPTARPRIPEKRCAAVGSTQNRAVWPDRLAPGEGV